MDLQLTGFHHLTAITANAAENLRFYTETLGMRTETSIPGFGKFKVKASPEREGCNPSTGATVKIAASKKLTFAPAKALKDALNK